MVYLFWEVVATLKGEHPWGWRTALFLDTANRLTITAYNISAEEEGPKATETIYKRVSA